MDARRIPVSLRRDPREIAERHSQANPLTLYCELARGEEVTEALSLYAELHTSRTPQSAPVATAGPVAMAPAGTGPWELDFSAAQMNQTVLPGEDREYWLVVYATGANDLLLTLATIRLTLAYDNISQTTPAPPEPALIFAFRTIAVAGQSSIVADTSADTLTIAAGNGIVLTTNAGTDTLTITAAGGAGSGDVSGPNSATDNAIARFDGTTGKILQNSGATLSDAGGILADTLAISTTPTGAGGTGIFRYDDGEKVPEVGIDGVTLKIGVQEYVRVYNATASTLTKGQVVYISGAQGNRVAVQLADASVEATSAGTLGLVAQSITAGSEGFVQVSGPMYNLNTLGLTAGALLYLSETAGQWTETEPPAPAHGVRIGYVERVHASAGSIYIKVDNGYELGELHNVSDGITGATAFLVKNSATNLWESKNASDSRSALGLGSLATQSGTFSGTSSGTNTGDVTLAGQSYLTLVGQQITAAQINLGTQVTGTLPIANGGTGATTAGAALTSLGAYPASNPNGYTSNVGTVTSVTGTAPISVSNGTTTPAITVTTFGTSNSGVVPASGGGSTNFLRADGTWAAPSGGGGGAPTDADYLVRTANGSLSAERVVTDSTTVTANWATSGQVSFERAALTGDVTASANSNTTTIANDAVTYAKIQNVAASRLLGRASGTSGDVEEITLGTNLSFSGTTLNATGGSATVDVQKFTASGTWNNPSPSSPRPVLVRLIGAGGGGGGGRCGVSGSVRGGGGGGTAGAVIEVWLDTAYLDSTEAITIGAGGTAGTGSSTQGTDGGAGGTGGDTTMATPGITLTAVGGAGGAGGTSSTGGSGGAAGAASTTIIGLTRTNSSAGGAGSSGAANGSTAASTDNWIPTSGGGGGGSDSSNTARGGGSGGNAGPTGANRITGGTAGASAGGNGGAGAQYALYGIGGGGGGSGATAAAGNGGAGGRYGGGGGGGGGGTTTGGAGGVGGDGYAVIITYL